VLKTIGDMRLLVVDDSTVALRILKVMLVSLSVRQIYTAKDGREAIDFLGSSDDLVDVVLCDWNMPSISGLEVLRQVRSVDPDLPFVMVTGMADEQAVVEARAAGVTAYIVKPYTQDQLAKILTRIQRLPNQRSNPAAGENAH
jgi:two-component system chemotaxis response regulator CheY